jgi:hypothetical protein
MPTGKLKDTYGLAGILARYHELLETFTTSQDKALGPTPFNPYLSLPRAFLRDFRTYRPSFLRQARISSRQFDQVPNALQRNLAGADLVLAELEGLTTAQFAAIEECHRANAKGLRRRSILGRGKMAVLISVAVTAIGYVVSAVEKVAGIKPGDLWPHIKNIDLTAAALPSNITFWGVFFLVMIAMGVIINLITFAPKIRRAEAFEDVLTIAKAYRKGESEKA